MEPVFEAPLVPKLAVGYAPGKVIVGGEHAVVYGHPAFALPLPFGIRVLTTAQTLPRSNPRPLEERCKVQSDAMDILSPTSLEQLRGTFPDAVSAFRKIIGFWNRGYEADHSLHLNFRIDGDLIPASGLGSSAATLVALYRSLEAIRPFHPEIQCESAVFEAEAVFHGTPSGIDHSTSILGKPCMFRRSGKKIECEALHCAKEQPWLLVTRARQSRTQFSVDQIKRRYRKEPIRVSKAFDAIALLVLKMRDNYRHAQPKELGSLMNENHRILEDLGLVSKEAAALHPMLIEKGALGAKVSGAAGDKLCLLALLKPELDPKVITRELESKVMNIECRSFSA